MMLPSATPMNRFCDAANELRFSSISAVVAAWVLATSVPVR